ncbi:adenosylhomocysteinase [Salinibacterium sp. NSLL150]|uniref:adenosylhomocysteinase n=1 Tax=unclassified Salinibacterium TaxID=2632331 RepID=UPI0018CF9300|nr:MULTISPECIES: adenosylhomocysteinase [unclassified Salinibacterium]MBH0099746.1 adenosylhomocysteinase [Salinibacterium sp. NSLL35]MBH0102500.1 adenosylhomocysteinase [Salinibacterium sp. NSLL150]MBH0105260.1 adenosylhomocysteinase [Salinibacterium sp. NSLL16]MBH0108020.1 adenosylhomocysteinase [Salinibacterium sp. NSLL17]MBH0110786.1 adenosylhomocysteinase [Salinibacterium sp. NG22]
MTNDLIDGAAARLLWVRSRMPLLAEVRKRFEQAKPFAGHRIGMAMHLEPKTAVLLETLKAGGAEIVATGNLGSTQDDVVAYLRSQGMTIFGARDDSECEYEAHIRNVVESKPDIILDNGAGIVARLVELGETDRIVGGTEETTSGSYRLREELATHIRFPIIVIDDNPLTVINENKHAAGQSVVESFMRVTNVMVSGRRFVVAGYGWCGRGVAHYLRALGGKVAVVEVDEIKALEAALDGYRVANVFDLAGWGEVFITATGHPQVLTTDFFEVVADGAMLVNCGHFDWEIDVLALRDAATSTTVIDGAIERVNLPGNRHVTLLADGRMINLAGREPRGNSIESMDLGFLLQALSLERIATAAGTLEPGAQPVPDSINREAARRMLAAMKADR